MADELIDVLDKTGKFTGQTALKSIVHRLGLYHASIHIWLYTLDNKILVQKRAKQKEVFPDLWDISVAGHISAGENPKQAALREIEEEIGIYPTMEELDFIGIYLSEKQPKPDLFDNEFHHIYISQLHTPIKELKLQKEEVSEIKLCGIKDFRNEISTTNYGIKYVPHDAAYYDLILTAITNRLP